MLSNTATPKYYGEFRDAVMSGKIPVCHTISQEMNRIDALIANPGVYYDPDPVEGWVRFCENELTLTDGSDMHLLPSFKVWGEQIFGWYYFVEQEVWQPGKGNYNSGSYVTKRIKKRLITEQYLIVGRGAAKTIYDSTIQGYGLTVDTETTSQVTTAPTMKQADEVLAPLRTAIQRARGPLFQFLTMGSNNNTTGSRANRQQLCSTKKGIQNFMTNSILEIRPMTRDKLQGYRDKIATVDEWLSGNIKENVIGAIEQGSSKNDDYLIIATSSEGTARNGPGDDIKMRLIDILNGKYISPRTSIWYYRLDDVKEVGNPDLWIKANPNIAALGKYEAYQEDVDKAENDPTQRNDILAKRFGIPSEGYTYFFTYEETKVHRHRTFDGMPCALGIDLSQGNDFTAFTFLFPLDDGCFGIKVRSYISDTTYHKLPPSMRRKYDEFIAEGSLVIMPGTILDLDDVYDDLDRDIEELRYDVRSLGYDPYNAKDFIERWSRENGPYGIEKVIQGAKTESVPLGELKKLSEQSLLLFDEKLMSFTMGNAIVISDTNGNMKLLKRKYEEKIDNVSALMDAWVSYKAFKENFL